MGLQRNIIDVQTGTLNYSGESKIFLYTDGIFDNENYTTRENIENLKALVIKGRKVKADDLLKKALAQYSNKDGSMKSDGDVALITATIYWDIAPRIQIAMLYFAQEDQEAV